MGPELVLSGIVVIFDVLQCKYTDIIYPPSSRYPAKGFYVFTVSFAFRHVLIEHLESTNVGDNLR